jgi:hypothetical protein
MKNLDFLPDPKFSSIVKTALNNEEKYWTRNTEHNFNFGLDI